MGRESGNKNECKIQTRTVLWGEKFRDKWWELNEKNKNLINQIYQSHLNINILQQSLEKPKSSKDVNLEKISGTSFTFNLK